jgi:branched-chain amino acid transport system substrate-binding protein
MHFGRNLLALAAAVLTAASANAADTIKFGLSVPLSGGAASSGRGLEWACQQAAKEVEVSGGFKVSGKVYNFECIAYDNKYSSAEGTKVAQTLLNRDGVQYVVAVLGTPPFQALQSLSERRGVVIFTMSWANNTKGPKFPLTFTEVLTPNEVFPDFVKYVANANPGAKTVALLSTNDSTGKEVEPKAQEAWKKVGHHDRREWRRQINSHQGNMRFAEARPPGPSGSSATT